MDHGRVDQGSELEAGAGQDTKSGTEFGSLRENFVSLILHIL